MESLEKALTLMKRQAVLEAAMKRRGGIRVTEERELHSVRRMLTEFPDVMRLVLQAAHALHRPIGELSSGELQAWASSAQA
jgi:hypothetical protein